MHVQCCHDITNRHLCQLQPTAQGTPLWLCRQTIICKTGREYPIARAWKEAAVIVLVWPEARVLTGDMLGRELQPDVLTPGGKGCGPITLAASTLSSSR